MKSYKFDIKGVLIINATTPEEAEKYLRECLNPNGEMFNIEADGVEVSNKNSLQGMDVYEEYSVNIR